MLLEHPFIDWLLTIFAALVVAQYNKNTSALFIFIVLIFISIPLHIYFDVPTNTNYYLNLSEPAKSKKISY